MIEDDERHRQQQQALLMLKLMVQGERDVENGQLAAQNRVFADARQRLIACRPRDD